MLQTNFHNVYINQGIFNNIFLNIHCFEIRKKSQFTLKFISLKRFLGKFFSNFVVIFFRILVNWINCIKCPQEISRKQVSLVRIQKLYVFKNYILNLGEKKLLELNSCKMPVKKPGEVIETSKKFQKCDYEIRLQKHKVAKLDEEVKMRREKFFPQECIEIKEIELAQERNKYECMIEKAVELEKLYKNENFGTIFIEIDKETDKVPPRTPSGISKISGIEGCYFIESMLDNQGDLEETNSKLQVDFTFH